MRCKPDSLVLVLMLFLCSNASVLSSGAGEDTLGPKGPPPELRAMSPQWEKGDSWTVKVFYRSLALGKKRREKQEERREMDSTLFWTYKVTKTRQYSKAELIRVQVKDRNKERSEIASLTFARQQLEPNEAERTSLLRGRFLRKFRGKREKTQVIVSDPGQEPSPSLTESTSIPYDMPVFPIGVRSPRDKSLASKEGKTLALASTLYQITEDTGPEGFKYAMDIEQSEYLNPDLDAFMWKGAKKLLKEQDYPTKDLIAVKLYRPFDGVEVRQLWHPNAPWPLLSIGPWYRTVLVYHSGESPRR